MEKFNKSMIGKKVRFTNGIAHTIMPKCYPPVGTIGVIKSLSSDFCIEWPEDSVSEDGIIDKNTWLCGEDSIELIEEDESERMSEEEIFKMLISKFNKNGFSVRSLFDGNYKLIEKAITIAYCSGYGRGKKNRPFKIGGDKNC